MSPCAFLPSTAGFKASARFVCVLIHKIGRTAPNFSPSGASSLAFKLIM
jgi:hypothetical protein